MKKTVYITGGVSIVALFSILASIPGVVLDVGGDIKCMGSEDNPCYGYFNVTSKNVTVSLRSKDGLGITMDQPVQSFWIERKLRGKWQKVDFSKNFTFTRGVKYQFRLAVVKVNPSDAVKWGVKAGSVYVDPLFLPSTDLRLLNNASTIRESYFEEVVTAVRNCTFNAANNSWQPCVNITQERKSRTRVTGTWQELSNAGRVLNVTALGFYCEEAGDEIRCASLADGTGNIRSVVQKAGTEWFAVNSSNAAIKTIIRNDDGRVARVREVAR